MIFYRLACYEEGRAVIKSGCVKLSMHSSEAAGKKVMAKHKRHLKKVNKAGSARLERIELDAEFMTKGDWMSLVLGDSNGGLADEDQEVKFISDYITETKIVSEWTVEPKED
jgi:hypothetical protein